MAPPRRPRRARESRHAPRHPRRAPGARHAMMQHQLLHTLTFVLVTDA